MTHTEAEQLAKRLTTIWMKDSSVLTQCNGISENYENYFWFEFDDGEKRLTACYDHLGNSRFVLVRLTRDGSWNETGRLDFNSADQRLVERSLYDKDDYASFEEFAVNNSDDFRCGLFLSIGRIEHTAHEAMEWLDKGRELGLDEAYLQGLVR